MVATAHEELPFTGRKPVAEMSLVEIAEELEKVTSWIEQQRVREREARAVYQAVAQQVEQNIQAIKSFADDLLSHQHRRMSSFSGMLGRDVSPVETTEKPRALKALGTAVSSVIEPKNLAEAIVNIWALEQYDEPLTTEEILDALQDVGYKSDAVLTSIRSSINQALAKLCRSGRVIRFRADGSIIDPTDNKSRARKYISALRVREGEMVGAP